METTVKRPPKPKKIDTVAKLAEKVERARGLYFTEYKGLTVEEITDLRRQCYQNKIEYLVVKNTFSRRVLKEKGYDFAIPHLVGPTAICFGYADPATPAKVLYDFSQKNEKLVLKGGVLEGKPIGAKDIAAIKDLPNREQAIAMTIGAIFGPVQAFHNVLTAVLRDFVSVIDQIAEQKQAAA
jgi:large subunit ribosomal protein L10